MDHSAAGDLLRSADARAVRVLRRSTPAVTSGDMWDLTVATDHDVYVQAGDIDVLVHNCSATGTEAATSLDKLRRAAVRQAWRDERAMLETGGGGTRLWTEAEEQELLETGRVRGYNGHHTITSLTSRSWRGIRTTSRF